MKKQKRPFTISYGGKSLSFTPFGARFVFVCLALGAAAINSGSNLLYLVTAMMLSLMLVSGVLSEQALRGIRVARRLPDEIYALTPFTVHYMVSNLKRRTASFGLAVSGLPGGGPGGGPVGGAGGGAFLHRLGPGEEASRFADGQAPVRGRWELGGVSVFTRFPFGLFMKGTSSPGGETRIVFPRLAPLDEGLMRRLTGGLGELSSRRKGHGPDIFNLRRHLPGDDARLIHWKSSARLSTLMSREFEQTEKDSVSVVVDNYAPHDPPPGFDARFEACVSLAASVVHRLMVGHGLGVSLVTRDGSLGPGRGREHYEAVMRRLALLLPSDARAGDGDASRALSAGPSVLVVADARSPWSAMSERAGVVLEAGDEV